LAQGRTDWNEQSSQRLSIWQRIFLVSYWLVLSRDFVSYDARIVQSPTHVEFSLVNKSTRRATSNLHVSSASGIESLEFCVVQYFIATLVALVNTSQRFTMNLAVGYVAFWFYPFKSGILIINRY